MKNKSIIFTASLLAIALVNYWWIVGPDFRAVEFFSVLAVGMLTGVFLVQFFYKFKKQESGKHSNP